MVPSLKELWRESGTGGRQDGLRAAMAGGGSLQDQEVRREWGKDGCGCQS